MAAGIIPTCNRDVVQCQIPTTADMEQAEITDGECITFNREASAFNDDWTCPKKVDT